MSQRRTARRLLAAGLAGLLLAGCTPPGLPAPQSPSAATSTAATAAASKAITIGIDGPIGGFNPYAVADFSSASRAVASLVLPSVSKVEPDGAVELDHRLVRSATVTDEQPFTVTYDLVRDAAWSDGTPVTAEDFRYLHQQLISQSGTRDSAPYRSITEIRSEDAGKKVVVVFAAPVQDWLTMFSPLLPAHILKDAPGGFAGGLEGGVPVSAGPYRLVSVDRITGLISLSRNDKFWAGQPRAPNVQLRVGTGTELVSALDRGDVQAVFIRPNSQAQEQLTASVPADRRTTVAIPATVQLAFDTVQGPAATPQVRRAVAAGLSQDVIVDALSGSRPDGLRPANSMVQLPAEPDAVAGAGAVFGNAATAKAELERAGYLTSGLYATKEGVPLKLVLGYGAGDVQITNTARAIQQQLGRVGIEVDLLVDTPAVIVDRLGTGGIDMALLTVPRGSSDAVAAASQFSCPAKDGPRGSNLTGYCNDSVRSTLAAVLTGAGTVTSLNRPLWTDLPTIPLGEPVAMFAVAPALAAVIPRAGPGWLWSGPLSGIGSWPTP